MDSRRSVLSINYFSIVKRFSSGHAHGEETVHISPYRKPIIPPNRPLAFFLGATLIAGAFSMTGFFMFPEVPKQIPPHKLDRKPKYEQTSIAAMTVHDPKDHLK